MLVVKELLRVSLFVCEVLSEKISRPDFVCSEVRSKQSTFVGGTIWFSASFAVEIVTTNDETWRHNRSTLTMRFVFQLKQKIVRTACQTSLKVPAPQKSDWNCWGERKKKLRIVANFTLSCKILLGNVCNVNYHIKYAAHSGIHNMYKHSNITVESLNSDFLWNFPLRERWFR